MRKKNRIEQKLYDMFFFQPEHEKNMAVSYVFMYFRKTISDKGMNSNDKSIVELFDICSTNIRNRNPFSFLNQNGFLLCRKGHVSLMMDDNLYHVKKGDMYIYPAFSKTDVIDFSDDLEGIAGTADFDFILSSMDSISDTQSHVYIRFHPLVSLTAGQQGRIEELLRISKARMEIDTILKPQITFSLIQAFCYEVVDAFITNNSMQTARQTHNGKIFQNFLVLLFKNCHTRRDVLFYASQLNLTPRYFTTIVRKTSGKTPSQWISLFVITEAKRLLSQPKASIKEIAALLHFTDQSYFGRYFKLYAGCSPSAYKHSPDNV